MVLLYITASFQVGYLLGLGDRHPSNLMLNRHRFVPCQYVSVVSNDCFHIIKFLTSFHLFFQW